MVNSFVSGRTLGKMAILAVVDGNMAELVERTREEMVRHVAERNAGCAR